MITIAERLLSIVESTGPPKCGTSIDCSGMTQEQIDLGIARFKLGLDLSKKPILVFKSIVEDWDMERIVRELY